ncbi:MAG: flagellar hook capping protein [Actinomycetota bacterium]|nr:flagellar hook capping protein [Actinomycetota bacterium]
MSNPIAPTAPTVTPTWTAAAAGTSPSSTSGAGSTSGSSANATASSNPLAQLTQGNTFLNLLVAQLTHQNPTNPMSPSSLMAQTAQLTQVESLTALSSSQSKMVSELNTLTATGMIGKQVTGTDSSGAAVTGVVSSVKVGPTGPSLLVGTSAVALSSVTSVK